MSNPTTSTSIMETQTMLILAATKEMMLQLDTLTNQASQAMTTLIVTR